MAYRVQEAKDLFIVDNSDAGWKGLRYLEEWCDISKQFDVATGFFEIGALLAMDGKWQQLEGIRILIGSETTRRTRRRTCSRRCARTFARSWTPVWRLRKGRTRS
ncbi:MAG: hypothetical protein U5L08_07870 [Xanthomonadales bacterium]|nr:hypothetical protein [Xanthomonadales bacterium]